MRFVLSLIVGVTVLGAIQASSEEIALGVSLASVDNRVTVGSSRNDCPDEDWNTAAIKEGESESAEMTTASGPLLSTVSNPGNLPISEVAGAGSKVGKKARCKAGLFSL
jgi:hypothetical protein